MFSGRIVRRDWMIFAALVLCGSGVHRLAAEEETPKPDAEAVRALVGEFKDKDSRQLMSFSYEYGSRLDAEAEKSVPAAEALLKARADVVTDAGFVKMLEELAKAKKRVVAARLLLQYMRAWHVAKGMSEHPRVVAGQLVIQDTKLDPALVLAQMMILEDGFFVGELGDMKRPVCFRAHGYQDLDVPMEGREGDVILVGKVTMKPLAKADQAMLKGKVVLEGPPLPEGKTVELKLNAAFGTPNTPHGGYSPRPRWPELVTVTVDKNGEFTAKGLNPSGYDLFLSAEGFTNLHQRITLEKRKELDVGELKLRTTNLGYFISAPLPKAGPLAWEEDFEAALKKAGEQKKPIMVMMTATWCGPCRLLEEQTLSDPWMRHFLASFIVVKAYEVKEVEERYGLQGYPTLVFTDSAGKSAFKTVGYKPTVPFAAEVAKAMKALSMKLPPELEKLIEKKIVVLDQAG